MYKQIREQVDDYKKLAGSTKKRHVTLNSLPLWLSGSDK